MAFQKEKRGCRHARWLLTLRGTGSARSTGRSPARSSGCVSTRPAGREEGGGGSALCRLASSEPRGLGESVNSVGLRHFTRMQLLRAATQPSCRGVHHRLVGSHACSWTFVLGFFLSFFFAHSLFLLEPVTDRCCSQCNEMQWIPFPPRDMSSVVYNNATVGLKILITRFFYLFI